MNEPVFLKDASPDLLTVDFERCAHKRLRIGEKWLNLQFNCGWHCAGNRAGDLEG